jgi:hypothetical protein
MLKNMVTKLIAARLATAEHSRLFLRDTLADNKNLINIKLFGEQGFGPVLLFAYSKGFCRFSCEKPK